METKLSQLHKRIAENDITGSLRIVSRFWDGMPKDDLKRVKRAFECTWQPDFYAAIGFSPETEIAAGWDLVVKYFKPRENHQSPPAS